MLEADPAYVGGISRTAKYKGYHFDIGGHRFFSKSKEVEDFWTEILPDDMLDRPRSSRIFYNGQFFAYPLKAGEALFKLGVFEAPRCVLSYMKARMFPIQNPRTSRIGSQPVRLPALQHLLQDLHGEGVGHELQGDLRRLGRPGIKGLSLKTAILNALWKPKPKNKGEVIKTLIDSFRYPRKGPGHDVGGVRRQGQEDGRRRSAWAARWWAATGTPRPDSGKSPMRMRKSVGT